jgi:hypothetical protein
MASPKFSQCEATRSLKEIQEPRIGTGNHTPEPAVMASVEPSLDSGVVVGMIFNLDLELLGK